MSEPAGRRTARITEHVRVAQALHAQSGGSDTVQLEHWPPELAREVRAWQERVRQEGWQLDADEWTLGLLTLSRLAEPADAVEALGSVRELK